jgi:SAM-dependent methyltransferase
MSQDADPQQFDAATGDRVVRFFDADYADYLDDLPALMAYARRLGGPILELGCGTGRVAVALAQAGNAVTGVDISPAMLDVARRRAFGTPAADRLTLIEGDFTIASLGGPYRFAFIVMNTFLHLLTQADQMRALRHWRAHLAPGGLLLIDVFFPDIDELARLNGLVEFEKSWPDTENNGIVMKQVIRSVDPAEQILHVIFLYDTVTPGGHVQRTVVPFDLRYLWRFEAELLLTKAGFSIEGVYGDWELNPLDSGSDRMILVARKDT